MKKATAFLTLISLLAMIGGAGYLYNRDAAPNFADLQPVVDNLKTLIPETMHVPALAGIGIFLLITFLLSLLVLFEPKQVIIDEKPEKLSAPPEPQTAVNNAEELKKQKELEELQNRLAEAETAQNQLKCQTTELTAANVSLKAKLDKLSNSSIDKSELEAAQNRGIKLESDLNAARLNEEKITAELKTVSDTKIRLQSEVEALLSKTERIDQEFKIARKETEKVSSQLKNSLSECEKKAEEAAGLRQQIEAVTQELKSAQANQKGGKHAIPPAAYQILYLFQKEGRLIDLLSEDISQLDDETLGGAIRPIHEGCRKLLVDRLILERVLDEEEGSEVTLDEIDPEAIKLSGKVPSTGPYKGELIHRGWRLKECNLPELVDGWKGNVIAPAEIEIG